MHNLNFENISFDSAAHRYTFTNKPDLQPLSVTGLVHKYSKPFDEDYWATKKAGDLGVSPEEIKAEWKAKGDLAKSKGTLCHLYMEDYYNNVPFSIPENTPDNVKDSFLRLKPMQDNFIKSSSATLEHVCSELVVGDEEWNVCGMIDQIFKIKQTGEYVIFDWKTNSKFNKTSRYKLIGSMSHLDDSHLNQYSIQLGLYKKILEKNKNVKISGCFICWFGEANSTYQINRCRSLTDEIDTILEERKNEF